METKKHTAFTKNGLAKISKKVGGTFSAHGGYISGFNLNLIENKLIVQAWRARNWPKGVYSIVSFKIGKEGAGTKLIFDHTGLPEKEVDHLAEGWKKMYWDRIAWRPGPETRCRYINSQETSRNHVPTQHAKNA